MIADFANVAPAGTCEINRPFFDIGTVAFTNIFKAGAGYGAAMFRLVPAPVVGNVKMVCVMNSGGYYVELRPYNHRAGVSKLEVQSGSDPWKELPRSSYNSFVYTSGTPLGSPFNTRITSRFGEVVTFPAISSMSTSNRFTANAQFTVFPDQGPSPVWIQPPVYTEGFTNILGAIRSEGAAINGLKMQIGGFDAAGDTAQSIAVTLSTVDTSWRAWRIPLDPAATPIQINRFLLMNSTSTALPAINLDSIAFRW